MIKHKRRFLSLLSLLVWLSIAEAFGISSNYGTTYPFLVESKTVLNVRNGPGTNYPIIRTLSKGERVIALSDAGGGWYGVIPLSEYYESEVESITFYFDEIPLEPTGYLSAKYVKRVAPYNVTLAKVPSESKKEITKIVSSIFGQIWSIVRVVLIIILIIFILVFRLEILAIVYCVFIGGISLGIIGLFFGITDMSLAYTGAIIGGIFGGVLMFFDNKEKISAFFHSGGNILFRIFSFPFNVLNHLQITLSEPWRYFFKKNFYMRDKSREVYRTIFNILHIILQIAITPLRVLNALYFNVLINILMGFFDSLMEFFNPSHLNEGANHFFKWLRFLPWRAIKYLLVFNILNLIESVVWTVIDTFIPAVTLYHGTETADACKIVGWAKENSGTFLSSRYGWAGAGVYFGSRINTAQRYAYDDHRTTSSDPAIIVVRVTLGRIINLSLAPKIVYVATGSNRAYSKVNSFAESNNYTSGEWWNIPNRYWEFCLFDRKNLYNTPWRIRPIYVYNFETGLIQHIPSTRTLWVFRINPHKRGHRYLPKM